MSTSTSSPSSAPLPSHLRGLLALNGEAFVEAAYQLLLGRPADDSGRTHYLARLDEGASKMSLLRELQSSPEGRTAARALPGLPPAVARRWWTGLPGLRSLAAGPAARDELLALGIAVQQGQAELSARIVELQSRLAALQSESSRRLGELEHDIVLRAGGLYARDNWEAMHSVLTLQADSFIHEAFRVALQRAPAANELEHFRHLQSVGIGQHTLLAGLLGSAEARSRNGDPSQTLPADQPALSGDPPPAAARRPAVVPPAAVGSLPQPWASQLSGVSFRPAGTPVVSVIIPVYGKVDYTLRCLASIAQNRPQCSFEVIVVDDKSPDNTVELLQQVHGVRLLVNEVNLGFVRNCNRGAAEARGRYLCFLNNDTEVRPGWLDELVGTYGMFPNAGLIGSKLVFPDGTLQEAGGIVWNDASAWNFGRGQDPGRSVFNYARETDYCSGASILIETSLFEQLGRFDERFVPAYCEDTSLAFAVRAAGRQVIYQPKSEVIHYEGVSHGTSTSSGIKAYQVINQKKFHELWRDTLEREHFPNAQHVPLARERSALRRIVLVIDHYVPQPDRDAGSRTMWQFMRMFQEQGLVVKLWPENLWRDPVYTPLLERAGIEVFYGPEYANRFDDWIRENGPYLEAVLLSRPHISVKFTAALRRHSRAHLLYYGHDVHHLRLRRQLALKYDADLEEAMIDVERQEKRVWSEVDTIYYPAHDETRTVDEWLRRSGLPAQARTIPVYAFDTFPEAPWDNLRDRSGLIFVAGFGHPPNSGAALWFASEVFPILQRRQPGLKLTLIGSNPTAEVKALQGGDITVTGYVSDDALAQYYLRARVSVAPLLYGGGMKGKVVEAMRFGLPCVTSPAGAQGLEEALGFLAVAADPGAFAQEVLRLLEDDALWLERSQAAQAHARQKFSVQALWNVVSVDVRTSPFETPAQRFDARPAVEIT